MKVALVCVLLVTISGPTLTLVRDHIFISQTKNWRQARDHCKEYFEDLSTIRNQEENDLLKNAIPMANYNGQSWIGYCWLRGDQWYWIDGTQSSYTNWAPSEPISGDGDVTVMNKKGEWKNTARDKTKTFFCSWWHREFILVTERLTWEEALLYCREHYTDMASVLTPDEATHLADGKPVENRTTEQLWTSLRFLAGQWLWVSERTATTIQSQRELTKGLLPICPAEPYTCGARAPGLRRWENRDCQERLNFLCYRAGPGD